MSLSAPDRLSLESAPAGLSWQAFSAAYFPGRRRHDLEALTAYAAYRRSHRAEQEADERGPGDAISDWEDEGGQTV